MQTIAVPTARTNHQALRLLIAAVVVVVVALTALYFAGRSGGRTVPNTFTPVPAAASVQAVSQPFENCLRQHAC
jgi:hypothetical protein